MATQIAIGALRYFLLKFTRNYGDRVRFSGGAELRGRDRAVRAVRGGARAQHSAQAGGERRAACRTFARELDAARRWRGSLQSEDFWQMLLAASKADSAVERAVAAGEPAHVARVRVPTGAGVQQFLPAVPDHSRGESREEGVPVVDDGFLPPATGAHACPFWGFGRRSTCRLV